MEVSSMASMIDFLREGHLQAVFQMFSFLDIKHNVFVMFDPTDPDIDKTRFPTECWSATPYGSCKDDASPNASSSRGIGFTIRVFVDSDNSGIESQELALHCFFTIILSLFIRRNRGVLRHQVLVMSS